MTKPRIRILNGKPVYQLIVQHPVPSLIQHLEKLLKKAKDGKIRAIIEIIEWEDGTVGDGWSMEDSRQRTRLLGQLSETITHIAFSGTIHADKLYEDEE